MSQPSDAPTENPAEVRDSRWVADRFGDVGPPPSNEVTVDPDAVEAPNLGDHD